MVDWLHTCTRHSESAKLNFNHKHQFVIRRMNEHVGRVYMELHSTRLYVSTLHYHPHLRHWLHFVSIPIPFISCCALFPSLPLAEVYGSITLVNYLSNSEELTTGILLNFLLSSSHSGNRSVPIPTWLISAWWLVSCDSSMAIFMLYAGTGCVLLHRLDVLLISRLLIVTSHAI